MTRCTALACAWIWMAMALPPGVALADPPQPYMRVQQPDDQTVALQVAVRRFVHPDGKAAVYLAGVVHLGDQGYYQQLQQHLDEQALVLYEGVGRPGFLDRTEASDAVRRRRTTEALYFLAYQLQQYRHRHGGFPLSLKLLESEMSQRNKMEAHWVKAALTDGWGGAVRYRRGEPDAGFTLVSLGSDDAAGGEGAAADVTVSDVAPEHAPPPEPEQLQASLATALGLVFQLDAIDYDRPHFRNSDLSLRRLQQVIDRPARKPDVPGPFNDAARHLDPQLHEAGEDDAAEPIPAISGDTGQQLEQMMSLLSGESALAGVVRLATRFIGASPQLRSMVKLMMIEMLGQMDGDISQMQGMPAGMADLMKVLIRDRNEVVIRDLRRIIESHDPPRSISIFYGAGHMPDLEQRLVEQMGYQPAGDEWLTAFSANAGETGLSPEQLQIMRASIKAQMKSLQARPGPRPRN